MHSLLPTLPGWIYMNSFSWPINFLRAITTKSLMVNYIDWSTIVARLSSLATTKLHTQVSNNNFYRISLMQICFFWLLGKKNPQIQNARGSYLTYVHKNIKKKIKHKKSAYDFPYYMALLATNHIFGWENDIIIHMWKKNLTVFH